MQAMDCFLMPSLYEGLPMVLVEAQASGLPCLISDAIPEDCDIAPTLVERVALSESPESWSSRIERLAAEPNDRAAGARDVAEAGFDAKGSQRSCRTSISPRRRGRAMSEPLVSIVVPAFNAEDSIGRCLGSIMIQTYSNLEVIVVDDGSTDGTSGVAEGLRQSDARLRVIRQGNAGVSAARNVGLAAARGDWVAFVDADDLMEERAVGLLLDSALGPRRPWPWARCRSTLSMRTGASSRRCAGGLLRGRRRGRRPLRGSVRRRPIAELMREALFQGPFGGELHRIRRGAELL